MSKNKKAPIIVDLQLTGNVAGYPEVVRRWLSGELKYELCATLGINPVDLEIHDISIRGGTPLIIQVEEITNGEKDI